MNFGFLGNIADGLRDLFSSVMFFIPHYKTQPGEIKIDGEYKNCELSGLFFLGYVIRGVITIDSSVDSGKTSDTGESNDSDKTSN